MRHGQLPAIYAEILRKVVIVMLEYRLEKWWRSLTAEERRHIAARAARLDVELDLGDPPDARAYSERGNFLPLSSGLYNRLRRQDAHIKGGESDD